MTRRVADKEPERTPFIPFITRLTSSTPAPAWT